MSTSVETSPLLRFRANEVRKRSVVRKHADSAAVIVVAHVGIDGVAFSRAG